MKTILFTSTAHFLVTLFYLERGINGTLTTKPYDKPDDFSFSIVNYPPLFFVISTFLSWYDTGNTL